MAFADPNNVTSIRDIAIYASDVSNGAYGLVILIVSFFVLFIALSRFGVKRALGTSSVIAAIMSYFLYLTGLLNVYLMYITIGITILALVGLTFSRDS